MSRIRLSVRPRTPPWQWVALVALFVSLVTVQTMADATTTKLASPSITWIRSPGLMKRLSLEFDALMADFYWIRAVQYYGDTKLSTNEHKNYDLLYPLLDITTTLDPDFKIAYRFGAILLSEGYPSGAARPDYAIALLEKGIKHSPERWEYFHDAGFVEYWWRQDYPAASAWLQKAAQVPGAPNWLAPVAASMLAEGGSRESARALWQQIEQSAEQDWLRKSAQRGLMQLDAEEQLDQLRTLVSRFEQRAGRRPTGWGELVQVGWLRGVPVDPTGVAYAFDAATGAIDVAHESTLYPLRRRAPKTGGRS
jgi:hypothetical protein